MTAPHGMSVDRGARGAMPAAPGRPFPLSLTPWYRTDRDAARCAIAWHDAVPEAG